MKIAIATKSSFDAVSGHAGQSRHWLLYDLSAHTPDKLIPPPTPVTLDKDEVLHVFKDDRPHPLDRVDIIVANSAGEGFKRHMQQRGAQVLLTGESDPARVLTQIMAGEALPDTGFDLSTSLCKIRDLFSRY